ncbi:unnamed protein product [Amoebophrya sp. A120]|nr:unnamed protein product [Amoebophrya sp. A120]|eukprot:GSA120T00002999001.1
MGVLAARANAQYSEERSDLSAEENDNPHAAPGSFSENDDRTALSGSVVPALQKRDCPPSPQRPITPGCAKQKTALAESCERFWNYVLDHHAPRWFRERVQRKIPFEQFLDDYYQRTFRTRRILLESEELEENSQKYSPTAEPYRQLTIAPGVLDRKIDREEHRPKSPQLTLNSLTEHEFLLCETLTRMYQVDCEGPDALLHRLRTRLRADAPFLKRLVAVSQNRKEAALC